VVYLEACVGAVKLVFCATTTFELIRTLFGAWSAGDPIKFRLLLFSRQELFLLFFEEE